ncbi:MAG: hypothetical protein U1E83_05750 [Methylotetracoccus sp.]
MSDKRLTRRHPLLNVAIYVPLALGIAVLGAAWLSYPPALRSLLVVGVLVLLGFGLPRWIGGRERARRAAQALDRERLKWGFHGRDRDGAWINYIDRPLVVTSECAKGRYFYGERLVIHDGWIVVNPGESLIDKATQTVIYRPDRRQTYAWDGCTPKLWFYWLGLLGTPDWWVHLEPVQFIDEHGALVASPDANTTLWPLAHHASLVHDALYQYLGVIPITKREVDAQFETMLRASGFIGPVASLYHLAVRWFGGRDVAPDDRADNSPRRVAGLPFLTASLDADT